MKRHRSLIAILIAILTIIFSMQSVSFAWTTGTNSYYITDGNKVETSINSLGQTVYRVYQITNNQKSLIHEVFARSNNIWNNTTSVLLANGTNKSASYCGLDRNLNVYGIDTSSVAGRFKYGFTKWDTPERLTEHPGAYGFKYDDDGFIIGIYTSDGLYDIERDMITEDRNGSNLGWNYDENSEYPFIIQDGNQYYCNVSPSRSYTYVLSSSRLNYNGHIVDSYVNADIQCGVYGFLVYTTEDQAHIVRMGSYNSEVLCDNFEEFVYQGNRVTGAKDVYGRTYWISDYMNSYDEYDDYYWDDDYDYDYDYTNYPNIMQDGNYYYFNKNSYSKYKYELNSSGSLYVWNSNGNRQYIASKVDYIVFSNEYMFYVRGSKADGARIGSAETTRTYPQFVDFEYDENGMVIAVITSKGTTWVE